MSTQKFLKPEKRFFIPAVIVTALSIGLFIFAEIPKTPTKAGFSTDRFGNVLSDGGTVYVKGPENVAWQVIASVVAIVAISLLIASFVSAWRLTPEYAEQQRIKREAFEEERKLRKEAQAAATLRQQEEREVNDGSTLLVPELSTGYAITSWGTFLLIIGLVGSAIGISLIAGSSYNLVSGVITLTISLSIFMSGCWLLFIFMFVRALGEIIGKHIAEAANFLNKNS